jgi:hypothetical protein
MEVTIKIPDDLLEEMPMFKTEEDVKCFFAGKLYEANILGSYAASQIAEMDKLDFIRIMGKKFNIAFINMTLEELEEDIKASEKFRR